VSKWYGTFQVLTDCTTDVAKGEVVVSAALGQRQIDPHQGA
jgi:ABC-type polar amino acid transport system ATPase subunit